MPENTPQQFVDTAIEERYADLLTKVRAELEYGIRQARAVMNLARLRTYWHIGKHITDSYLDEDYRAAYGMSVYKKLEEHLDFKERVLQHMVQFHRTYPECPEATPLTWTHYRYLLNIPDTEERRKAEQEMIAQGMTSTQAKSACSA